ncbi:MAG: iron-sulfur cluster repair di-iron protein [Cyclobacteriaceae bacterium]|nr:iron-sulfur cluster repair di-iron protein [Cyclobacteriaceae bacterium]MCH8516904.1 iron-sulfur cluster repair di-iron protein [Cyclobacteriaceae bacterium]
MSEKHLYSKPLVELISEDYVLGYVLHYLGIDFYNYDEQTLEEVCRKHRIGPEMVFEGLRKLRSLEELSLAKVNAYPIELIIEYLKHSHYTFIKHKLPYIAGMIKDLPQEGGAEELQLVNDLKMVFPLFVEDFIQHVYEEEDGLFRHVERLRAAMKGDAQSVSALVRAAFQTKVQEFALDHDFHDDEMRGIREITDGYAISEKTPLHIRVIFSEMLDFERALQRHSQIENEILFPKALRLETQAYRQIANQRNFN